MTGIKITTVDAANAVIVVLRTMLDSLYRVPARDVFDFREDITEVADVFRGMYLTWLFTKPTEDEIHYLSNILNLTRECYEATYGDTVTLAEADFDTVNQAILDNAYYLELNRQADGTSEDDMEDERDNCTCN